MKNKSITFIIFKQLLLLMTCFLWASPTWAFSKIYVFGDSLSDTGNLFEVTGLPPSPPYFNGHFSNGPIWNEYLATEFGVAQEDLINFAWGGALTGAGNLYENLPGLHTQIEDYINSAQPVMVDALYVIWAGANDFSAADFSITDPFAVVEQAVSNIEYAVKQLLEYGVQHLVVINIPDFSKTPRILKQDSTIQALLSQLSQYFNVKLWERMQPLPAIYVDIATQFNQVIDHPQRYELSNVIDACFDKTTLQVCPTPDSYFFWDDIHPTTLIHQLIAGIVVDTISPLLVRFTQPFTAVKVNGGIALDWEILECKRNNIAEIQLWRAQLPAGEVNCPTDLSRYHLDTLEQLTALPQIDTYGTSDACYGLNVIEDNGKQNWHFTLVEP